MEKEKEELLKAWIVDHDNKIIFNILYIGLALVLSIWLGLFWLVAVVAIHVIIEFFRQYLLSGKTGYSVMESLWELKLDIGLIFFAFWLAVYLDFIFGVAGLAAGTRVAAQTGGRIAQTGTRVAIWQRVIRSVFMSLDDVGLAFKVLARGKKGKKQDIEEIISKKDERKMETTASPIYQKTENTLKTSWLKQYSKGDWFAIGFAVISLVTLIGAPLLIDKNLEEVIRTIMMELKPFPG